MKKRPSLALAIFGLFALGGCDEIFGGDEVTVTVTGTANVRDAATTSGSKVIGKLEAGTELSGTWVETGSGPRDQWLEFDFNGKKAFVWSGNLSTSENEPEPNEAALANAVYGISFGDGYEQHPARLFNGNPAPLSLTRDQKDFVTRLTEAYAQATNFSGSLVVVQIGCGTGCSFAYALDKRTGRATPFPVGGEGYQGMQIHARSDSTLVWASWHPSASWESCVAQAWKFDNAGFSEVMAEALVDCDDRDRLPSI